MTLTITPDRLDAIEARLHRLEQKVKDLVETPVAPWQHLVQRRHNWRTQLYIKGRNMTARQLVGAVKANHLDENSAAANYRLPSFAIREALAYVEQNEDLIESEAEIERLMLQRPGGNGAPQPLS